jgi:hypothetical protein
LGTKPIRFINNDEAVRPDGERGPGLFACLRSLQGRNGDGRRDVIANVFRGVTNRMVSGYPLLISPSPVAFRLSRAARRGRASGGRT